MRYYHKTGDYEFTEKERNKLLKRMNKEFSDTWDNYEERRRRWEILETFMDGQQVYDRRNQRVVGHEISAAQSESGDVDDEFFIFNLCRRIHLSNMQRLTGYAIDTMIRPRSKDQNDKRGARAGRIAIGDLIENHGRDKLKRDIAWYLDVRGTAFLKWSFDSNRGDLIHPLMTREDGEVVPDTSKKIPEGEMYLEVVDPANTIMPEGVECLEETDWIEHFAVLTIDEIYRRTGVKVKPESVDPDKYKYAVGSERTQKLKYRKHAILRTRYYRPSPKYQKGAIFTYTTDHMIRSTELLKFYDDIPFASAHAIYNSQSPYGETWLWDLIPNCNAVNIYLTAITNYSKLLPKLNMQAPAGANIKMKKVDSGTGNIHVYQGEKGLEPLTFPELPQSLVQGFNLLHNTAMSLGAAHDISRMSRALSGNAIAALQQIDDSVLRPTLTGVGEMLSKAAEGLLRGMDRFYTVPRMVRMTGMKGWEIIEDFKGEMLNGNFKATINLMTGLSNNMILRQETLFKMHKQGGIDSEELRVHMEFGSVEDLYEKIQKADENAERVLAGILDYPENYQEVPATDPRTNAPILDPNTGQPAVEEQCMTIFHSFDDHMTLTKKLLEFMRENYDHIEDQPVRQTLRRHLEYHQQFMQMTATPPPPGAGPAAEALAGQPFPIGGEAPGKPGPVPGYQPGEGAAKSVQNPAQQPDRDFVETPGVRG